MMKKYLFIIFFLFHTCLLALPANDLKVVGESRLSIWFWDIYDIQLSSLNGDYQENQLPIAIELTYHRDISKQDLLDETAKQWQRFKLNDNAEKIWLTQLSQIWLSVHKNDRIRFYVDENKVTYFYYNDQFIGKIVDADFTDAFKLIWLSLDGPYPEVTKELISARGR